MLCAVLKVIIDTSKTYLYIQILIKHAYWNFKTFSLSTTSNLTFFFFKPWRFPVGLPTATPEVGVPENTLWWRVWAGLPSQLTPCCYCYNIHLTQTRLLHVGEYSPTAREQHRQQQQHHRVAYSTLCLLVCHNMGISLSHTQNKRHTIQFSEEI